MRDFAPRGDLNNFVSNVSGGDPSWQLKCTWIHAKQWAMKPTTETQFMGQSHKYVWI